MVDVEPNVNSEFLLMDWVLLMSVLLVIESLSMDWVSLADFLFAVSLCTFSDFEIFNFPLDRTMHVNGRCAKEVFLLAISKKNRGYWTSSQWLNIEVDIEIVSCNTSSRN